MPELRPLPVTPTLRADEPVLSLVRRLARLNGLQVRYLLPQLGATRGRAECWQAAQLSVAAAQRLSVLADVDEDHLSRMLPDLHPTLAVPQAAVQRRTPPRPWFGHREPCRACLSERDGATRHEWEQPWQLVCPRHNVTLRHPSRDLRAAPTIIDAQQRLDRLVRHAGMRQTADITDLAAELVDRWRFWGRLDDVVAARTACLQRHPRRTDVLHAVTNGIILLPEIVRLSETLISAPCPRAWLTEGGQIAGELQTLSCSLTGSELPPAAWKPLRSAAIQARRTEPAATYAQR